MQKNWSGLLQNWVSGHPIAAPSANSSGKPSPTTAAHVYEDLQGKIAVLGGIDLNFLATRSPEEVSRRCRLMLERTWDRGGYALGSGNSIPDFVPVENYMAMIRVAHEFYA